MRYRAEHLLGAWGYGFGGVRLQVCREREVITSEHVLQMPQRLDSFEVSLGADSVGFGLSAGDRRLRCGHLCVVLGLGEQGLQGGVGCGLHGSQRIDQIHDPRLPRWLGRVGRCWAWCDVGHVIAEFAAQEPIDDIAARSLVRLGAKLGEHLELEGASAPPAANSVGLDSAAGEFCDAIGGQPRFVVDSVGSAVVHRHTP